MIVLVVELVDVVVVVGNGQVAGGLASLRRKTRSSLPSFRAVPPNSVQYCSVFNVSTTLTGDIPPFRSIATAYPCRRPC
jgi:hypothetical protein